VRERLARGASITGVQMARALQAREAIAATFDEVFRDVDVLLAPTVTALPPRIGEQVAHIDGEEVPLLDAFTRLCSPQNMAGIPALSIPCGFSRDGMPIALQLIAARGRDDIVLALGAAFQRETDWHERRPPIAERDTRAGT
jgi:Asp-tRNA(Asn)/Glu-tRNA(Gln) amidotransferase A subunit family amidase